jgi:hypothetical protein
MPSAAMKRKTAANRRITGIARLAFIFFPNVQGHPRLPASRFLPNERSESAGSVTRAAVRCTALFAFFSYRNIGFRNESQQIFRVDLTVWKQNTHFFPIEQACRLDQSVDFCLGGSLNETP